MPLAERNELEATFNNVIVIAQEATARRRKAVADRQNRRKAQSDKSSRESTTVWIWANDGDRTRDHGVTIHCLYHLTTSAILLF